MMSRRSWLLAAAAAVTAGSGAAAQWGERRHHRRRHHGDHDCARRALEDGRAKPLAELLPTIEATLGGQVIEVELERCSGRIVYEVKVLRPDGRLIETVVDALTGQVVGDKL